jgi:hypothetical protein
MGGGMSVSRGSASGRDGCGMIVPCDGQVEGQSKGKGTRADGGGDYGNDADRQSTKHRYANRQPCSASLLTSRSNRHQPFSPLLDSSQTIPFHLVFCRRNLAVPQPRVFTRFLSATGTAAAPNHPPLRKLVSAPLSPPPGEMEKKPSPLRPPSSPSSTSTHRRPGTGGTATRSGPSVGSATRGSFNQHQRPFQPSLE